MQAMIKEYLADDACKKERRETDKQLTKLVQQISGTQYNVSFNFWQPAYFILPDDARWRARSLS